MQQAEYNKLFKQLLALNEKKKSLAAEAADVGAEFDRVREEVIDAMLENENKLAEEIDGYRVSRTNFVSCSLKKENLEEALVLSTQLGFRDAVGFNAQRMTSIMKAMFPDAFDGTTINLDLIPENMRECFSVYSRPTLSIRKK